MIAVDASEFRRLRDDANVFDRAIIRAMRKRIKEIGQIGIDAVKKALDEAPPNDQPGSAGSRAGIAAGLRTTVSFSGRSAGVRIQATNTKLAAGHKGFAAAYETKGLTHPVYGRAGSSVPQSTRGYFGASIGDALYERGAPLVMEAVAEAMKAIGAKGL